MEQHLAARQAAGWAAAAGATDCQPACPRPIGTDQSQRPARHGTLPQAFPQLLVAAGLRQHGLQHHPHQ